MYYLSLSFLFLVTLNIPTILLFSVSPSVASNTSYFMFSIGVLLILLNNDKYPINLKYLYISSILFYFFGLLTNTREFPVLIIEFVKFSIFIFALYTAQNFVGIKVILLFLLIGALTILSDALFFRFKDIAYNAYEMIEYGRYAGFYLNANSAAAICLSGYAIALVVNNRIRLILLLLFTLMGFLTLSRTFIFSWIIINIVFSLKSPKHLRFIPVLLFIFPILISFQSILGLRIDRFNSLINLFTNGRFDQLMTNNSSRVKLFSEYYRSISNSPIFGNGFNSFRTGELIDKDVGAHNTFLMIIGEAGILPFLFFVAFFVYLFYKTIKNLKYSILPLFVLIIIFIQFNVSHNFFDMGFRVFMMTFLLYQLNNNYNGKYFPKIKE